MFNSSNNIILLLEGDDLCKAIVKSIEQARAIIAGLLDRQEIMPNEVTSSGKNPLKRATIFKFFQRYDTSENEKMFDKHWVLKLWKLNQNGMGCSTKLKAIFTPNSQNEKLTNQFKGTLKQDVELILHLLWCNKAVLLTVTSKIPVTKLRKGGEASHSSFEYAAQTYPEMLKIFKKLALPDENFDVVNIFKDMHKEATSNFNWYGWRLIRASTWYEVEDVTSEELETAWLYCKEEISYPIQIKSWFTLIQNYYPDRAKYSIENIGINKQTKIHIDKETNIASPEFFVPDEITEKISTWCHAILAFGVKIKNKKIKTWKNKRNIATSLVSYFVDHVYKKCGEELVPHISEFDRKYIDGVDPIPSLLDWLRRDNIDTSYQRKLYQIYDFLEFIEIYKSDLKFKNPLSTRFDFPFVKRSKGSNKNIFASEYFSIIYKYLSAISEWFWYIIQQQKMTATGIDNNIKNFDFNSASNQGLYVTESTGYIPIIEIDGKYHPIHYIPTAFSPVYRRKYKSQDYTNNFLVPHHIHQALFMLETGIRHKHVNWLERKTYDVHIDRNTYNEHDVQLVKILVNTDKSHDAWNCETLSTALNLLDRQKEYQSYFNDKGLFDEVWYDGHEESIFGKINSLFAKGAAAPNKSVDAAQPFSNEVFIKKWRLMLYTANLFCQDMLGMDGILLRPAELSDVGSFDDEESFKIAIDAFEPKQVPYTPHGIRKQVVSELIPILPPSEIKKITGHATDAHVIYYAQIDDGYLDKVKDFQNLALESGLTKADQIPDKIDDVDQLNVVFKKADEINNKLRNALIKNKNAALNEMGAISYNQPRSEGDNLTSGLMSIKQKTIDQIAFNSTHICPFNNECPNEILRDFPFAKTYKPCGGCYYSVKVVDHIPRILGKIRTYTSESEELDVYIKQCKKKEVPNQTIEEYSNRRKFLSDEITSWTVAMYCLEQMKQSLKDKDNWLVAKPELLNEHFVKIKVEEGSLKDLLLKASEAKSHEEYFTPALKYQIKSTRMKLLAKTGQFSELLKEIPDDFTLLDEFRGQIKSICSVLNIGIDELASKLSEPTSLPERTSSSLGLLLGKRGVNNG